jgi:hypothetical protein
MKTVYKHECISCNGHTFDFCAIDRGDYDDDKQVRE